MAASEREKVCKAGEESSRGSIGTLGTCSGTDGTLDQHDECGSCLGLRGTNMGLRTGPLTGLACTFTGCAG